jgi:polyhydroxyalkanoate synthase
MKGRSAPPLRKRAAPARRRSASTRRRDGVGQQVESHEAAVTEAVEGFLGPNPFAGLGLTDVLAVARQIATPGLMRTAVALDHQARFAYELIRIMTLRSELTPERGDKRFQDPAFSRNPFYRALLQGYLAWRQFVHGLVEGTRLEGADAARARFVVTLLTEALAPTNFLPGNPAALKRVIDTGGGSLVRGLQNFIDDLATNGGMPSQVDKSAFRVGDNLACSAGAVVFRNEVCELIQYRPSGAEVHGRPLLCVAPQINKFYVLDLAPGKSLIEYAVQGGVQTFAISWRNPQASQCSWGLETYVSAIVEAMDAVRDITGSPDLNVLCVCAGAVTTMPLLAHLAARGKRAKERVHSATLVVALLDTQAGSQFSLFATPETVALAKRASEVKGVLGGGEMARAFAWLRPNDLVWNYWVNNYLMGDSPPAFDILFWNSDSTRLPARLHSEFLDLFLANPFQHPGRHELLGTKVDLRKVTCDAYIVAGVTDHITPWQGCYSTTQMLGGERQFVLSSSGHIQSLVNPPGNPKARFFTNPQLPREPEEWLAGAQAHGGSWWEHWRDWLVERSGEKQPAPSTLGSKKNPPKDPAPGTYVFAT